MITAKFGGTSVTAQNLGNLKSLVTENHGCVVVSAIGKEHPRDTKVTDLLIRHFNGDSSAWRQIVEKYRKAVVTNGIKIDVDRILFDAKNRSGFNLACCLSLGEELSAKIAAAFLGGNYIEAADCVVFDKNGKFLWRPTKTNLQSAFRGVKLGVIGGFYGGIIGDARLRHVFPRGGGDVTGAICAAALGSSLYENFTDVNGVCDVDPKRIPAKTIPQLSYCQMYALSRRGAEVLHPDAVRICRKFGVPVCVRNSLAPCGNSTLISNCPSLEPFLSVTEQFLNGIFRVSVLHSMSAGEISRKLSMLFEIFGGTSVKCGDILSFSVCLNLLEIKSRVSILKEIYNIFSA